MRKRCNKGERMYLGRLGLHAHHKVCDANSIRMPPSGLQRLTQGGEQSGVNFVVTPWESLGTVALGSGIVQLKLRQDVLNLMGLQKKSQVAIQCVIAVFWKEDFHWAVWVGFRTISILQGIFLDKLMQLDVLIIWEHMMVARAVCISLLLP